MEHPIKDDLIEKQLGFKLDQGDKVNELFLQWLKDNNESSLKLILIWAYHWIRRYFFKKFMSFQIKSENDVEELNTKCLIKFYNNRHKLREGHILPAWINLLCKRALLDYYRTNQYLFTKIPIDDDLYVYDFIDQLIEELDSRDIIRVVMKELSKQLSPNIIKILELKIIEQKNNIQIAREMNLEPKTIMNYCYIAMDKIRNSKIIMDLLEERTDKRLPMYSKKRDK